MNLSKFDITKFQNDLIAYRKDYSRYVSSIDEHRDIIPDNKVSFDYKDKLFDVSFFQGAKYGSNRLYLVVPSCFNSSSILDFSNDSSIIESLRLKGDVYLLNWLQVDNQGKLETYINSVTNFVNYLYSFADKSKVSLVGHCIGGNIALCSAGSVVDKIDSITLLTTPWSFSHIKDRVRLAVNSGIFDPVRNLDMIPELYVRLLFFLLFPGHFSQKLARYSSIVAEEKIKLIKIEHWLHSGISLSNSLFFQIIDDIVLGDYFSIDKLQKFGLQKITCPVLNVCTNKDRLAPEASSKIILTQLSQVSSLILPGGHISYLINGQNSLGKFL